MEEPPDKLSRGEPLTIEELIGCFPSLAEKDAKGKELISPGQLRNYALGAAVWRRFRPGEIICREGEFGSTAFFIVKGKVKIYIENPLAQVRKKPAFWGIFSSMRSRLSSDENQTGKNQWIGIDATVDLPRDKPIAEMGPGDLFGEMTCRTYQPRSATVRATEDCEMVEILRVVLDMLVGSRLPSTAIKESTKIKLPTFKGTSFKLEMDARYRERSLFTHLRGVPLFATLDEEFIQTLTCHAELISYNQGDIIFKQGDVADAFYLVRMGLVKVSQAMPGGEMVRNYLSRGHFFGEVGLMKGGVRTATCAALDGVDLVRIQEADFRAILERCPAVAHQCELLAEQYAANDHKSSLPEGLNLDQYLDQGLFEAQNLLLIDLDSCTRCDACVNACADAHDGVTRLIRDGLRYDKWLVPTACRSCRDPLCMTQCPVGSIRRKESLEILIEDWCIGCAKCAELCPYGNINMHPFEVMKEVAAPVKAAPAAKTEIKAELKSEAKSPEKPLAKTPAKPAPPPKMIRKKSTITKATTCDLCTDLSTPSCVYACPHDAAKRVDPSEFLAKQITGTGAGGKALWKAFSKQKKRTTH